MKLLLDENQPIRLKYRFSATLEVSTISDEDWNDIKDSLLLDRMKTRNFNILITSDKHIQHQ